MDILPPSFEPGSEADKRARSAALRHQGSTSVVPGPDREAYKGSQSSDWQYCRELTPEELAGFSRSPQNPVIVAGPGEQFSPKTPEAPKDGHNDRFELMGRLRKVGIRLGALAAAVVVAVGGIRGIDSDLREEADRASESRPNCQTVVLEDDPKHYPGGLVGLGNEDFHDVKTALSKLDGGYDVSYTEYGTPVLGSSEEADKFTKGTIAEFCVTPGGDLSVSYESPK